ncbi:MAG: hypothetical protein Q4D04_15500 [Clostridia bacterium]|nr:hypothetical protein [Clostridia bacterium]
MAKVPRTALKPILKMINGRDDALATAMTGDTVVLPPRPQIGMLTNWLEYEPVFYNDATEALHVWNSQTGKDIAVFPNTDRFVGGYCPNPAIFIVETWSTRSVCSLETGEVLWRMTRNADEHEMGSEYGLDVSGWFTDYMEGLPERLVITQGTAPYTWAYLTDNTGRQITRRYQTLEALTWRDGRGVFMFTSYDPADYEQGGDWAQDGGTPYEYGPTLRCGLIDQDGNILAPAIYTAIQVLSPTEFALSIEDRYSIMTIH